MCLLLTSLQTSPHWSQPSSAQPLLDTVPQGDTCLAIPGTRSLGMLQALKLPYKPQPPFLCCKQSFKMCLGLLWPHAHCPVLRTALVHAQGNAWSTPSWVILVSTGQAFPVMNKSCGVGGPAAGGEKLQQELLVSQPFSLWHLAATTRLAVDAAEGWDVPALQPQSQLWEHPP